MIKRIVLIMHKENVSRSLFGLMGRKPGTASKELEVERITQPRLFLLAAPGAYQKETRAAINSYDWFLKEVKGCCVGA